MRRLGLSSIQSPKKRQYQGRPKADKTAKEVVELVPQDTPKLTAPKTRDVRAKAAGTNTRVGKPLSAAAPRP